MYILRGSADGFAKPELLRDRKGNMMHTGRYWDPVSREHTSGVGPGGRAYSAFPIDWDADGDFDLLIGVDNGWVLLRRNDGTAKEPAFAEELIDTRVSVPGGYAMPVAGDWDGDGLWDLVSGSQNGAIFWARNAGEVGQPRFTGFRELVGGSTERVGSPAKRTQVDIADFDGDGDMDLLAGDMSMTSAGDQHTWSGWIWLFRRAGSPKVGAPPAARRQ